MGATIIVYSIKIPREITELTVQEYQIINVLKIIIYITFGFTTLLNIINYFINNRDSMRKTGYLISIFSISFIFIKEWPISIFSILAGIVIIISTFRERWVETNSITLLSIIGVIGVINVIIIGGCFAYKNLGSYILDKENENETAYKEDYFKYITELEITDAYINVKKDGKYGYITSDGNVVIDFQFEYASPFVPIVEYGKNFEIALVCKDGSTWIILKNLRQVLTYRSESMAQDYEAKLRELENVYYNVLGQTTKMHYEIDNKTDNMYRVPAYEDELASNVYRYNYSEEYDVIITKSSLGYGDTYELADKNNLNLRITLECENLCYDENYLYVYSNGNIPFFDISSKKQGWFTKYGNKVTLSGKAQILEIVGDNFLIKNHNDDTIYFIDSDGNSISNVYKEIFVCNLDRFIVKQSNNKYAIIDSEFNKVTEQEWDFVDASLAGAGIVVFGTTSDAISFNDYDYAENMKLRIVNLDGNIVCDNLEQVYNKYYYISENENQSYSQRYSEFLSSLKVMTSTFVGDEFYN
jgi:hypothetical protein